MDGVARARAAAEQVLGALREPPLRIASGMSCDAFRVVRAGTGVDAWIVRVPVEGTDRSIRFAAEGALGRALAGLGHPVARWTVVEVDGVPRAVGPMLPGSPTSGSPTWSPAFCSRLGDVLADLHGLPATGFGPLADDIGALRGEREAVVEGIRARWDRAACWPFDGSDLAGHPLSQTLPDAVPRLEAMRDDLLDAAGGRMGVVHSDLHREHLLTDGDGRLSGVLDFGDAFVGAPAWDFATLHWYYGPRASAAVAARSPGGAELDERGGVLALALGAYKVAKSPGDPIAVHRLRRVLEH